jgi:hypothetical protein
MGGCIPLLTKFTMKPSKPNKLSEQQLATTRRMKSVPRAQLRELHRERPRSPLGLVSEILRIGICRAERRNVEFGCLQDGFLGQIHEHLGIRVMYSVDMAR